MTEKPSKPSIERKKLEVVNVFVHDNNGTEVGRAELYVYKKPFPLVYVADIAVNEDCRGQGFGTALMEKVNEKIRSEQAVGVLMDDTEEEMDGFYERHEWVHNEDGGLLFYNAEGYTDEEISRAFNRNYKG